MSAAAIFALAAFEAWPHHPYMTPILLLLSLLAALTRTQ